MQQTNAAGPASTLFDHSGGGVGGPMQNNAGSTSDAGDAVMARWLQSAGLQHLAAPLPSSTGVPNLLMQVPYVYNSMGSCIFCYEVVRSFLCFVFLPFD